MSPARRTTSSATRPGHTPGRAVARALLVLVTGVCLTACAGLLTGCAGLLSPGAEPMPAPGIAPGVVGVAAPVERAPSPRPTSVGAITGEHPQESAAVEVQAAPSGSASRGSGRDPLPDGSGDGGPGDGGAGDGGAGDGGAGDGGAGSGGAGGGGSEDGSPGGDGAGGGGTEGGGTGEGGEPDLTDPVQYVAALEDAVNGHRTANGLPALTHDDCAYDVALERAQALIGQELAHAPLDPIFERCPTTAVAENLAKGGWTPAEAAQGWMDSEGHRANILNGGLTRGAIACVPDGGDPAAPTMICAHVFLA